MEPEILGVTDDNRLVSTYVPAVHTPLDPCIRDGDNFIMRESPLHGIRGYQKMGVVDLHRPHDYLRAYRGRILRNDTTDLWQKSNEFDIHIQEIHKDNYQDYQVQNPNAMVDDFRNMTAVLRHLQPYQHPNIANLVDCLEDENYIYIVTEFGGPDLYELVSTSSGHYDSLLDEKRVRNIFKQVVTALTFLQEVGVYHQDLQLDNIGLHENGVVKLMDFGRAVFVPRMTLAQIKQTFDQHNLGHNPYPAMYDRYDAEGNEQLIPLLIAPNILSGGRLTISPERITVHPATVPHLSNDMVTQNPFAFTAIPFDAYRSENWTLGIILYYLLTGSAPWTIAHRGDAFFIQNSQPDNVMQILQNMPTLAGTPMSLDVIDLVRTLLSSVDPATRLSLAQIRAHPCMDG
mmetsp:Transcript_34025/g.63538  ORF Transcript_34025/g.63538 Transcript_34025/m.63538 type:complete len:402 (-) Transcript_34025:115-1320(-)